VDKPGADYALGIFLCLAVFLSYLFQHVAIIRARSAAGISWLMTLFANISTGSNTLNAVFEQWDSIRCCSAGFSFLECNAYLLSIYQISVGFVNCFILYILLLIFYPSGGENDRANFVRAFLGFLGFLIFIVLIGSVVGAVFVVVDRDWLYTYAFYLGILSSVSNAVQWIPQIYKTFRAKDPGNLSLLLLLLQAPGSVLVVVFQGVLYRENVSTWLSFVVSGVMQFTLLVMCIIFKLRLRAAKPVTDSANIQEEKASLLKDTSNDM